MNSDGKGQELQKEPDCPLWHQPCSEVVKTNGCQWVTRIKGVVPGHMVPIEQTMCSVQVVAMALTQLVQITVSQGAGVPPGVKSQIDKLLRGG